MPRKAPLSQTANEMEVDDDEMPPPKPQQRKKRKGPKDSTPVMDGQTEEERRILRQEQRNLQDRIGERRAAMCALDSDEFAEQRDANNGLFKKVRYNREMVNDGDIMVGLAECAVARAGALAKSVKQYGAKDICTALKESYSNSRGEMDWAVLGRDSAGLFRAPPELNFFCGPLERPVKERKKIERKKKADLKDDGVEETQYQQKEGGADGDTVDEATNMRLQRLNDVMAAKMRSHHVEPKAADKAGETEGLDLMSLLVNPESLCETAENFFDLSFLVKDARATIGVDDNTGLPVCRLAEAPDGAVPKTQNVVVLSMADCKSIGELWGIDRSQLPREQGAREKAQQAAQGRPPPPEDEGGESDAY